MAGHARYTAVLDACVLFPIAVADALMSVAGTRIYAAKWTRRIEDEWTRNLEAKYAKPPGAFEARAQSMRDACPDWEVSEDAWSPLESAIKLPDLNDRHVVAAAIAGHADCIVTFNLKDFPSKTLSPWGIEVMHPDAFLLAQLDLDVVPVLAAFKAMRLRSSRPPFTPEEFAAKLEQASLTSVAQYVRHAAALI